MYLNQDPQLPVIWSENVGSAVAKNTILQLDENFESKQKPIDQIQWTNLKNRNETLLIWSNIHNNWSGLHNSHALGSEILPEKNETSKKNAEYNIYSTIHQIFIKTFDYNLNT